MINPELLQLLVCPQCKSPVRLAGEKIVCQNAACGLRYPVRNDIPVMLVDEAEPPEPGRSREPSGT